jgi:hypothetical protein
MGTLQVGRGKIEGQLITPIAPSRSIGIKFTPSNILLNCRLEKIKVSVKMLFILQGEEQNEKCPTMPRICKITFPEF